MFYCVFYERKKGEKSTGDIVLTKKKCVPTDIYICINLSYKHVWYFLKLFLKCGTADVLIGHINSMWHAHG